MADEVAKNEETRSCTTCKQTVETETFIQNNIEDLAPDGNSGEQVLEEWWAPKTTSDLNSFDDESKDRSNGYFENSVGDEGSADRSSSFETLRNPEQSEACSDELVHSKTQELHNDRGSDTEFRHRHINDKSSLLEGECKSEQGFRVTAFKGCDKEAGNKTEPLSSTEAVSEEKLGSSVERLSFMKYFTAEVFRGQLMELEEDKYSERREKVYIFMTIPREFEKLMVFGFMLCLDCFLFMFTFLPLRVTVALCKIVKGILLCRTARILQPAQICDLLKGSILLTCWLLLTYVDVSVLYHTVRGQSVIKLYVIYNMLEIADRLFSSFGQDILDALFWTATEPKDKKSEHIGIISHFAMAVAYVFFHAVLVLFQAICLNVAVNSYNKALLVIMLSNQFVELKGSVFKRFEKNNLFQMACSDIRERFHYIVLISIVTLRNLTEFNWNFEHLYVISPYLLAVLSSEYFVDWIKHAFITKFNNIPVEVYCEYRAHLAEDATSSRQKNAHADHFDLVSRRLGFIPLPLGSLVIKVIAQSVKLHGLAGVCLISTSFAFLTSVKVLNSIIFLGKASQYVHEKRQHEAHQSSTGNHASERTFMTQASTSSLDLPYSASVLLPSERDSGRVQGQDGQTKQRAKTLSEIERYTLCSKEIVVF